MDEESIFKKWVGVDEARQELIKKINKRKVWEQNEIIAEINEILGEKEETNDAK